MEFYVDDLSLKGPTANFTVDSINQSNALRPMIRKILVNEDGTLEIYSLWFKDFDKEAVMRCRDGKVLKFTKEEREWLEKVKKFLAIFQFIIEQDLNIYQ